MNRSDEWSKGGFLRNQGSFAERLVMFCQKAIVFAALVCFLIIWGGLVIMAQSETLSDLIKNGFRKGLLLTGQAEGFVRAGMLIVTAILVLLLLGAAFRHLKRAGKRRLYIISAVLLVLMIAIYVFFLTQLRIIPTNDARTIADLSYTIAQTGVESFDADSVYANYFSKYSNNYPIVLFLAGYFKVMRAFGITDIWMPLYLLNLAALLLGAFFTWLTARKVFGLRAAVKVQLVMTLSPVYYLMMFWVYTTTLSVPFVTGMIYLAFCIRDVAAGTDNDNYVGKYEATAACSGIEAIVIANPQADDSKGRIVSVEESVNRRKLECHCWVEVVVLSVLEGLLCSLGFLLRATNVIVDIAVVICLLLVIIRRAGPREIAEELNEAENDHDRIQADRGKVSAKGADKSIVVRWVAACLIAAIVAAGSYSTIHSVCMEYFASVSDGNYPITHWLMMGSHGDAMYNIEDDRFTFSLETAEEKKEATWAQTVENYQEAGVAGTLKLIVKKMIINWSDGYFAMDLRLEQSMKYSPVYTYIAGNHNDAFHLYCQGFWLAIGVLVIVACIRMLRMRRIPMLPFLLVLTLFGAMVFYWIWEVKPAYALPFLYLFYLLAVCGQEEPDGAANKPARVERQLTESENLSQEPDRQQRKIVWKKRRLISYVVVFLLGMEYLYNDLVNSGEPYYEYSIRCTQKSWMTQIAMEDGDTVTQTFYPNTAFNRIVLSVVARKDSEENREENSSGQTATCLDVTLWDAEGNVVYIGMITREDINSDNKVTLDVGEQSADSEGGYLLGITKRTGSFGNLALRTRKGILLNAYKGDFCINDVLQGTDLYMQVYKYCE